ncbi:MAG TPA: alanine racemase [Candidatus Ozemobacteraceae bacterium]|nr:alanine racemase [Candidatus Ozemobacteraceae bacterium]
MRLHGDSREFGQVTPVALVDEAVLGRNVRSAASFAAAHGIALRPHIKTHKCPTIARMQLEAGAAGITCATVDESAAFIEAGFHDIFIAYPIVGAGRLDLLKRLCSLARITVGIDAPEHIALLAALDLVAPLRVRIEIDCGHHRCGLPPGPAVVALAAAVSAAKGLVFDGVFTHAGHVYAATNTEKIRETALAEGAAVVEAARIIREAGIPCPQVSIGSTPTWRISGIMPGVTEARPGNYVYHDAIQVGLGVATLGDCAFTVLTTVIAVYADRFVVDAGSKALGLDKGAHGIELLKGYGFVLTEDGTPMPDWVPARLSEEHGIVPLSPESPRPRIGDRLQIIPNHSCAAANLFASVTFASDASTTHSLVGRHI